MSIWRPIRKAGKAAIGPFLAIALIGYFALNIMQGDRGLRAWVRLAHDVHAAEARLAAAEAERAQLENRAGLLKSNHLDPDLLDERARAALNVIGPSEMVIFLPRENP